MKRKHWKRKLLSFTIAAATLIVSAKLLAECAPIVSQATGRAAVISAGLTMPEGGQVLLDPELAQAHDPEEASQPDPAPAQTAQTEPQQESSAQTQDADTPPKAEFSQEEINQYSNESGQIIRKQYQAGSSEDYINISGNAYVRNMTDLPNQTVEEAIHNAPAFTLDKGSEPQVLIYHTHTTEAFELTERDYYDASYPSRSLSNDRTVVRVGDEITKQLEAAGIGVIHDTTVHDYPSYNGAYDRSKQTIESILAENPSIKVALDIHRDAIGSDNGPRYAPTVNINGRDAAQLMIVSGCDDGTMNYPNYLQNLSFASLLQQQTEQENPGLTRPMSFKYKYYNQSVTPGTLLVEVGGHANSVDEAIYTGWLFGKSLAHALQSIQQ